MKVLILGDGLLGGEIVKQTEWDYMSRKKDGIEVLYFNDWMTKLSEYDVIVNCIANTNTYSEDKESHLELNYHFVKDLVTYCNYSDKKLIHISTDYIYANSDNERKEIDVPVHHCSWYGYSKLLGDAHVEMESHNHLICRLSHKPTPFPYDSAWGDVITNADYTPKIVNLLVNLINLGKIGTYNVGTDKKSIFELASQTKKVKSVKSPKEAPKDVTMNIDKLNKIL
ncbi:sugar nucleotide-binding protein [Porticoccaceae bacterium]|nr:sugar nucleotide-binding protein [bacterium]MDB4277692.1 sugar nucleotide-binding protein [Gammaproteobacteria bacterium]MDB4352672.1 sugar nucleotide-binding protein [Porticoccaceae bacterium]